MIIYTSITNGYCELPEIKDLGHQYICFHDGTVNPKSGWELRDIKYKHEDPVVLSRHPKILFHEYFNEPCVYVDASRLHLVNNEEFIKTSQKILNKRKLFVLEHPEQHNYFEECLEYFIRSWVKEDKIVEFTKYLQEINYDFVNHETIFACVMWRKPTEDVIKWSNLWWEMYEKCGPRDQLSGSASLKLSSINYTVQHPVSIISEFAFYRDWWYDLAGGSGDYTRANNQLDWETFVEKISEVSKINCKSKIDLHHLRYLKASGFSEVYELLLNANIHSDTVKSKKRKKNYEEHEQALKAFDPRKSYDFIVYSCITNGYDQIPEDNYYDPRVKYVMFHDGTIDTTIGPWEYIDIRDYCDLTCPRRLSSFPKINPHKLFPSGENTVWIDACYIQTKDFIDFSRKIFPANVITLEHCYNFNYYDEMLEGYMCEFFSYEDGVNLTKKLAESGYNFKKYISPCCTMIWRTVQKNKIFTNFCDLWWEWSLVGSNRDQHSFDAARQFTGIDVARVYNRPPYTVVAGIDLKFDLKNKNRKGKHPKRGSNKQWRRREEFLKELQQYTKLNPKIYAKHEHITMMDWNNVFENETERNEYFMTSVTMRNLAHQKSLWGNPKSINDVIWSDHKTHEQKRIDAARADLIKQKVHSSKG
jgi:hypothetical protein